MNKTDPSLRFEAQIIEVPTPRSRRRRHHTSKAVRKDINTRLRQKTRAHWRSVARRVTNEMRLAFTG